MNKSIGFYFDKARKWKEEFTALRAIALSSSLEEELKWGHPCYTLNGANIFLIHGFKDYCALLFFKGSLMKDPKGLMVQQTENVQSARQLRFTNVKEIIKLKSVIKSYINEAIEIEKKGLKVELKKTSEYQMPPEFESRLKESSKLKTAFYSLTAGRQRAYLLYFSKAKQSATREARIKKCEKLILGGKGLND